MIFLGNYGFNSQSWPFVRDSFVLRTTGEQSGAVCRESAPRTCIIKPPDCVSDTAAAIRLLEGAGEHRLLDEVIGAAAYPLSPFEDAKAQQYLRGAVQPGDDINKPRTRSESHQLMRESSRKGRRKEMGRIDKYKQA